MSEKVKVLLVEDDSDFVFLIQKMINQDPHLDFIGYASNSVSGVEMAQRLRPDIVLMDLNLSGHELDGAAAAKEIRLKTDAKILLLTSYEQPEIIISQSKKAFASGYVFKSQCQTLTDVIYKTATSRTPQEQFIKELLLQELSHAERKVFNALLGENIDFASSKKTIDNQKTSIFKKLGLDGMKYRTKELIHIFRNW